MAETRKVVSGGAGNVAGLSRTKSFKAEKEQAVEGTFFGRRPPPDVQQLISLLANEVYTLPQNIQRAIVTIALQFALGKGVDSAVWGQISDKIAKANLGSDGLEQARVAFSAASTALKVAFRSNINSDVFIKDLTSLVLPPTFVADIQVAFNSGSKEWKDAIQVMKTAEASKAVVTSRWQPPLRWRLDVTISTSQLQRVLVPAFLMRIKDKTGKERTFEVNPASFHRLRYQVARVLKEFDTVEKLPILKIDKAQA